MGEFLHANFRGVRALNLKAWHDDALAHWRGQGLSAGTLANRLAHLHWTGRSPAGACRSTGR